MRIDCTEIKGWECEWPRCAVSFLCKPWKPKLEKSSAKQSGSKTKHVTPISVGVRAQKGFTAPGMSTIESWLLWHRFKKSPFLGQPNIGRADTMVCKMEDVKSARIMAWEQALLLLSLSMFSSTSLKLLLSFSGPSINCAGDEGHHTLMQCSITNSCSHLLQLKLPNGWLIVDWCFRAGGLEWVSL